MARKNSSFEGALADRLVGYADALAALAFVGVSGLGLAVADPDIRVDIARAADEICIGNLITGIVLSAVVFLFRRWELDLRANDDIPAKVSRYSRLLHYGRIGIIWFATLQSIGLMLIIR